MVLLRESHSSRQTAAPALAEEVGIVTIDMATAAATIFSELAPRAINMLTQRGPGVGGPSSDANLATRISPADCYVALDEACRKMARVAVRRWEPAGGEDFGTALKNIFPDPAAYLARSIKSVLADAGREERREPLTVSLDTPLNSGGDGEFTLADTLRNSRIDTMPEDSLIEQDEQQRFRNALTMAMGKVPSHYLDALKRDMRRDAQRSSGFAVGPESEKERQAVCRARAALSRMIRAECGEDNPYVRQLTKPRTATVKKRVAGGDWSGERQDALVKRLLGTGWVQRTPESADAKLEEAIINDVTSPSDLAPPTPEMRRSMRVLDIYTVDYAQPKGAAAREIYEKARSLREAGKLEEAVRYFRATYDTEPTFIEALNNVGNLYAQMGHLREALRVFMGIIERAPAGDHKFIAATNAADIYLTWADSGRNRDKNIENAIHYARMAMERPTPMRACNLLQALVKDRYYLEARSLLQELVSQPSDRCPPQRVLETLFQIRDADLVNWWRWLEQEMGKEQGQ